jgi:hypothetical protein
MKNTRTTETLEIAKKGGGHASLEYHDIESVEALTEYIAKTDRADRNIEHTSSKNGSNSFCGGDTLANAHKHTREGHPDTLAKVEKAVAAIREIACPENISAWVTSREVIGDCWDMGEVLAGVPECAIDTQPYQRRQDASIETDQVLSIALGICVSANVTPAAIQRRGAALVALVDALEHFGVRCEVRIELGSWWNQAGKDDSEYSLMSLLLKEADQPLEISRLAYIAAHAGFFRRIGFAWMERLQDVKVQYGYGKVCDVRKTLGDEALEDAGVCKVDISFAAEAGNYLNTMQANDWQDYIAKLLAERGIEISTQEAA